MTCAFTKYIGFHCSPPAVTPPQVALRWTCTFHCRSRPNVCSAVKMPGRMPLRAAVFLMMPAASRLGDFSSERFSLNTSHSAEGIVNVMCCQRVRGSLACCVAIHWSVAFLPHVGQNRLLQLKQTFLRCEQASLLQPWLA